VLTRTDILQAVSQLDFASLHTRSQSVARRTRKLCASTAHSSHALRGAKRKAESIAVSLRSLGA
jgi:hypothetical protein